MTPDVAARVKTIELALAVTQDIEAVHALDFLVREIEALQLLADGPKKAEKPKRAPVPSNGDAGSLAEFVRFAEIARQKIEPGKTDWTDSPMDWMRFNSPRTKSRLALDIVEEWFRSTNRHYALGDGEEHFIVSGECIDVHIGLKGKTGMIEFSQLREPGHGIDVMYLLGVEPERARIWAVDPRAVLELPQYRAQKDLFHHYTLDPDEIPPWAREIVCWEGAS